MLRWAHDHHRDLRTLESAQAAASARPNREGCFVTRLGLDHTRLAAIALRPMAHLVPDVLNYDPMVRSDHHSSISNRRAARQCHNNAAHQTRRSLGQSIPNVSQEANSP
jgi:hypothetical protein